jgi:predicted AAA+ superfamily ATPase
LPRPPFLRSEVTRLVKSPKLYVTDSGLACHLCGVEDLGPRSEELLRGALMETYVAQNLLGILAAHAPRQELCFWNIQGRHEVDFVLPKGKGFGAIEVKAGARFDDRDLTGLQTLLASSRSLRAGILATQGERAVDLGERLFVVPIGMLLS